MIRLEEKYMDKTEYLATMFNRRTKNKNYENFIVNAIYTLIGNKELIPVTQQYVKRKKGYALLDLYFPQLNYGIEVDEGQHLNLINQAKDKDREKEVRNAINCEEGRIAIYSAPNKLRKYEDIYKDILEQVKIVKSRIKEYEQAGKKLLWEDNDKLKKHIFERGYFDINDKVDYKGITEIYEGIMHKTPAQKCYLELNDHYWLWVPFLAIKLEDGSVITKNGWENSINEDMTEIEEIPEDKNKREDTRNLKSGPWNDNGIKRVVFMQMKDRFGKTCRKFLGVFEATRVENRKGRQYRYYKRTSTTFDFRNLQSAIHKKTK